MATRIAIRVPEITLYEVRRELLRIGLDARLDELVQLLERHPLAPITTPIMLRAAELWAEARRQGRPTATPGALDADVILASTALLVAEQGEPVVLVTSNRRHLERYVTCLDTSAVY